MKILGNILWLLFGGIFTALEYFISSFLLIITIVGIPFGMQTLKLGILALWPFGKTTVQGERASGCLYLIFNIIWILIGGIWIALTHFIFALILYITIIGIPFGNQHIKLASLALSPFGRDFRDK
ncbi:MAG: YccF domain-containing protein [Bacteroidales bacterium]|nr:YccF domain-containing protein [Bacteroidales bacterium]